MKSVQIRSFLVGIFPHSVQMRENADQKNSVFRQFLRGVLVPIFIINLINLC